MALDIFRLVVETPGARRQEYGKPNLFPRVPSFRS
jgi:hypothetical protein